MACSGSLFCDFCGGVCFLDTVADPCPYQRGLRARMKEDVMEMEPEEPTEVIETPPAATEPPAEPEPEPAPEDAA